MRVRPLKTLGDHLRDRVRRHQALFQAIVALLSAERGPIVDLALHNAAEGLSEAHALDKEIRELLALNGPAPIRPTRKPYLAKKATP